MKTSIRGELLERERDINKIEMDTHHTPLGEVKQAN